MTSHKLFMIYINGNSSMGSFETILESDVYKIKKLMILPDKRLSLQSHKYRNEHWIIIKGTALVEIGEEIKTMVTNNHSFVPKEIKHRIKNIGVDILELIEVQTGSSFDETDIIRYDDDFGRIQKN